MDASSSGRGGAAQKDAGKASVVAKSDETKSDAAKSDAAKSDAAKSAAIVPPSIEIAGRRYAIVHWSGIGLLFDSAGQDFAFFDHHRVCIRLCNNVAKPPVLTIEAEFVVTGLRDHVVAGKYRCQSERDRKTVRDFFARQSELRRGQLPWH